MDASFQLSLELTKAFPVRETVQSAGALIIGFARKLNLSGSDIIVEEDLAGIFGRGKIVPELESRFKKEILKNTTVTPVYHGCEIQLQAGPGPTVVRALRDQNQQYLSSVIQLSFLGWRYDYDGLTSALVKCMNKRHQMAIPGALPNPGYEGIRGTLEACVFPKNSFDWNLYVKKVGNKMKQFNSPESFSGLIRPMDSSSSTVSYSTLLAFMDYLYLVQSLPDDRIVTYSFLEGAVGLTVWAHYILGLTVLILVKDGNNVQFGSDQSPQVIMGYSRSTDTEPPSCGEVLPFDSSMSVILETGTDGWTQNGNLCSYETHTLEDFGSAVLRRRTNDLVFTSENSPLYMEMVHLIVAKVVVFSRNMHRPNSMTGKTNRSIHSSKFWNLELELYRLSDTAQIIFASYIIDFKSVERFVAQIQGLPLLEIPIGNNAEAFLKSAEASLKLLDPSMPAEN